MIEKYINDLITADLKETCKILNKIFKGVTILDAIEMSDELEECGKNYSLIKDCLMGCNNTLLKYTKPHSDDAYSRLSNIMGTLHYDNGLPLTGYNYPEDNPTEWNDYFEHYDRDQDFWSFYNDYEIYNFVTDGKEIFMKINCSLSELKDYLTTMYDGASWDHDF